MNILITGGAGFIGSHVADRFIAEGHNVTVIDNLVSGFETNVPSKAKFVKGDITDKELINKLFDEGQFNVVNHHAAQMDVRRSIADPTFDAQVNILGTINLLNASVLTGVKKVMFASTGGAIYGEQDYFPADENHPTRPLSPYGISKLACEKYLYFYQQQYGLKTGITRYANVYGPRQNPHGEAGVVAIFSKRLLAGDNLTINGDGLQTRDYVFVKDVVAANLAALNHDDSILFNVGTGIETDVVTLFNHLKTAAGSNYEPQHGPAAAGEQRRSVITPKYGKEVLGWEPTVNIADGLEQTYDWFKV